MLISLTFFNLSYANVRLACDSYGGGWSMRSYLFPSGSIGRSIAFIPSFNQSINQSINQSVSQSINESINQSIYQSIDQPVNRSIIDSCSHLASQSVSQSNKQSILFKSNQWNSQSVSQSIRQSQRQSFIEKGSQRLCSRERWEVPTIAGLSHICLRQTKKMPGISRTLTSIFCFMSRNFQLWVVIVIV